MGSEFKHLTHHVEDLQAGRFVVMVLAPRTANPGRGGGDSPRTRCGVRGVLWSMGVRVVASGFSEAAPAAGRTYDISAGQETIRIRLGEGAATVLGTPSFSAIATPVGASLWLISWRRNDTAIVHAIDVNTGVAYTSLMSPTPSRRMSKALSLPLSDNSVQRNP